MMEGSPSLVIDWQNEHYGFVVKVGGRPIYASKNIFHCAGVLDFLNNVPGLPELFLGGDR